MKLFIFAACLIATVFAPLVANAGITGNELYRMCNRSISGQCNDYVAGVTEGFQVAEKYYKGSPLFCIPSGVNQGQGANVVLKYLIEHPSDWHNDAAYLVLFATAKAWPCK